MKYIFTMLCLFLAISATSFAQKKNTADSIYHIQKNVLIPTKSGVDISAIIAHKKVNTQAMPVILFYTTYHQGEGDAIFARRSADRDYVGVVAYARGIRTDVENYMPYENEQSDIYDIIDWISKQDWCNGEVGMYGGSYTGFSQWATVKKIHPALKTIVPQVAVMPGFDFPMQNNVQLGFELNWSHTNILGKEPIPASLLWEWYERGYAYSKIDSALGYTNPHFQKWLQHLAYDEYWKSLVPTAEEYAKIDIPVLTTTGYFDGPQISAVEYFKLHNKYHPKAKHYLVIGPYDHWGGQANPSSNLRGYEIDSVANISMRKLAYEWLDWILKDAPKPELLKDKVNFQLMGTNTWRHEPSLQAMSNQSLRMYLHNNNLAKEVSKKPVFQQQTINFTNRESMNNYFHPTLIIDSLDASNGIVYASETFEKAFSINGPFTGQLVLETNKRDMDISISFYEQTEDKNYFLLSRYLGRASYAKDNSQRQLLTPGKKEQIPLNASHIISKEIKKGSRLVIVVNVNKHPFEIINYGSGKEPSEEIITDAGAPMIIKWFSDSYIEIPVWEN
ncbi:CocE/NonD family hydrolase [Marivirga sp. S37H4]|uniref:CocE/NonD family hydrolase n=1 Tax=Marivirga aurantiaca TaxID=2802615 RepID=A0A934WVP9_9BACT|nr:CocE/NonD family hydrolase [Marivirga aurantiaca]MBK6263837.1 CocE/NonD family hydrolase [Marivirga aurantiaca]